MFCLFSIYFPRQIKFMIQEQVLKIKPTVSIDISREILKCAKLKLIPERLSFCLFIFDKQI